MALVSYFDSDFRTWQRAMSDHWVEWFTAVQHTSMVLQLSLYTKKNRVCSIRNTKNAAGEKEYQLCNDPHMVKLRNATSCDNHVTKEMELPVKWTHNIGQL